LRLHNEGWSVVQVTSTDELGCPILTVTQPKKAVKNCAREGQAVNIHTLRVPSSTKNRDVAVKIGTDEKALWLDFVISGAAVQACQEAPQEEHRQARCFLFAFA
jgi:hypothetical protein